LSAGWHTISFRVKDPEGLWSDNAHRDLYVNIIPTAYAGENVSTTPKVPVQFNGQGEDEDGEIVLYEWDFDGNGIYDWADEFNGRELNLYNNEGVYNAVLRVTDNEGFTATDSVKITISEETEEIEDTVKELDLEDDEGIPSISLITSIISIGLLAIFRRK
jgi:PKD repeat protein